MAFDGSSELIKPRFTSRYLELIGVGIFSARPWLAATLVHKFKLISLYHFLSNIFIDPDINTIGDFSWERAKDLAVPFLRYALIESRGHRDRKKRPGVDFFAKAILAGLTN
jgi:hypothetical protein